MAPERRGGGRSCRIRPVERPSAFGVARLEAPSNPEPLDAAFGGVNDEWNHGTWEWDLDEVVARLRRKDGWAANELVREFWNGRPLQHALELLEHCDPDIARAGSFLFEECAPIVPALSPPLLAAMYGPRASVRYDLIDVALELGLRGDLRATAALMDRVADEKSSVRWKAMTYLAQVPEADLFAAVRETRSRCIGRYVHGAARAEPTEWFDDPDPMRARFALVRCLREPEAMEPQLVHAAYSNHSTVARTARRALGDLGLRARLRLP